MKSHIFILYGPSRAGKSTLIKAATNAIPNSLEIIKATVTRPRRENEKDDDLFNYFITVKDFAKKMNDGLFIEAAGYAGNYYGYEHRIIRNTLEHKHGICACTEDGILTLINAEYSLIPIKIAPVGAEYVRIGDNFYEKFPERKVADQMRAKIPIDYKIEVVNSFGPGGLEKAVKDLTHFINGFIRL